MKHGLAGWSGFGSSWNVTPCSFVRTDVSEGHIVSIIRLKSMGEGGDTFFLDVDSYKSHMASHPKSWLSS
jgi:hypothetical protein